MTNHRDRQAERILDDFRIAHFFCWGCGVDAIGYNVRDGIDYLRILNNHHIQKRGRISQPWNLGRFCQLCHSLIEGERIRHAGKLLPKLTLANVLWLKRRFDLENYKRELLRSRGRTLYLPPAQRPPEFFNGLWVTNTGGELWPVKQRRKVG